MTDRPWMTALEMQFAAMHHCATWARERTRPRMPEADGNPDNDFDRKPLVPLFKAAQTYAWSRESVSAVWLGSKTIPHDTCLDKAQLPSQAGWWWFDGGLDEKEFVALLWGPTDDGQLACCCFVKIGDIIDQGFSFTWKFGSTIADLYTSAQKSRKEGDGTTDAAVRNLTNVARFFVAACAWLQQRVLSSSSGHVERHRRKQLAREFDAPLVQSVNVIQLRRSQPQSSAMDSNNNAETTEWSCRWIVNGHWRNQPYKDSRKLIYILPYVKGPDDKPLKVPTHTVYAVTR